MARLLNKAITVTLILILFGSVYVSADEPGNTVETSEVLPSEEGSTEEISGSLTEGTEVTDPESSGVPETQTDYTESLKAINDKLYFIACVTFCGVLVNSLAFMFDCFGTLICGGKHENH